MVDLNSAAAYGADIAAIAATANKLRRSAAEAADNLSLDDPAGSLIYGVDMAVDLARVLGQEVPGSAAAGIAGFAGQVIQAYVSRLVEAMNRKGEAERLELAEAQHAMLEAMKRAGGPWQLELRPSQYDGQVTYDHYFTVGLPGVLGSKERLVFPRDTGDGCFRAGTAVRPSKATGTGRGPQKPGELSDSIPWRMWPAFYPCVWNTNALTLENTLALVGDDAANLMAQLATAIFDPPDNLAQDARVVRATYRRFMEWSAPMRQGRRYGRVVRGKPYEPHRVPGDKSGKPGIPDMPALPPVGTLPEKHRGPNGAVDADANSARNVYWDEQHPGLLWADQMVVPKSERWGTAQYTVPTAREWYDLDAAGNVIRRHSCTVDAYNHVLKTFGRFFAAREMIMQRRARWSEEAKRAAASSPDPVMQAALRRPPPPIGRQTGGGQNGSTKPGPGGVPARKLERKVERVGRVGEVATVLAAGDMPELARRLAALGARWAR